ncbi:hypothetical protein [Candidatus Endoriftia persephone]|uniref:Uncharacterized protein n=2 Tax=Gammaproteobacteria TaxID=1236 RepID=G2FD73_9GAMM|nr:hypothetical protein [Candidatus Endoriftia persephone]EGW55159.1 hypothetical protein TevJSym_ae00160 [endosymbiont of Tevnia jerichonana (vent Tica)]USF88754.1 hypothetical protein L0Y14_05845 [Candidatus Endoriftia persephone]
MAKPKPNRSRALQDRLNSLTSRYGRWRNKSHAERLGSPLERPQIPAGVGVGVAEKAGGTGGGIASPLTEQPNTRVFFDQPITSSDGLFIFDDLVPQTEKYTDADGAEVVINKANPYG